MVDKDFTYQVINELRETGSKKNHDDYDRTLMLGAANVMEQIIRGYLDLLDAKCGPDCHYTEKYGFVHEADCPNGVKEPE